MRLSIHGIPCEVGGDPAFVEAVAREHRPYLAERVEPPEVSIRGALGDLPDLPEGAVLADRAGDFDRWSKGDEDWYCSPGAVWHRRPDGDRVCLTGAARDPGALLELARVLLESAVADRLERRGFVPLHAAAVALDGSGLLFLGESGHGKSTLAAALCRQYGAAFIGDDTVFLDPDGLLYGYLPHVAVYAPDAPDAFTYTGGVRRRLIPPGEVGAVADRPVPPAAVFLLRRVRADRSRVHPVGARTAFALLAPAAADGVKPFFQPEGVRAGRISRRLSALHGLLERAPAYLLQAGQNPAEVSQTVLQALARPGDRAGAAASK